MPRSITPPEDRFGWIPPKDRPSEVQEAARDAIESMPDFRIIGDATGAGRRVVLWDAARKVYGKHLPTLRQEQGSCVEQGKINALMYLMCVERLAGDWERLEFPNLCHGYGWTRYYSGFPNRGHGALGSGAAKAAAVAGICPVGGYSLPDPRLVERSGRLEMSWGAANETHFSTYRTVPEDANAKAKLHLVRTTALVRSYEDVRAAISNGYPVTVASMQGFRMAPRVERGKHWGVPYGSWAHQMCFVGVDDDGERPGCYCLNSWGLDAHGPPADDAPPGGFWVDAEIVARMVRQGDSFAYSQFDGFPEQELDFRVIGEPTGDQLAAAESDLDRSTAQGVRP